MSLEGHFRTFTANEVVKAKTAVRYASSATSSASAALRSGLSNPFRGPAVDRDETAPSEPSRDHRSETSGRLRTVSSPREGKEILDVSTAEREAKVELGRML